jgi:hypothetical protein
MSNTEIRRLIPIWEISDLEFASISALLAVNGAAPVVVHPFYFGVTKSKRLEHIRSIVDATKGPTQGLAEELWQDQQIYMAGLSRSLQCDLFYGVGFVFQQAEYQAEHLSSLLLLHPGMRWVIIRTYKQNPVPMDGSWEMVLEVMHLLGLTEAYVGGYCACVTDTNELLPAAGDTYSCVNAVVEKMRGAVRFREVHVAWAFTYASPPPPPPA